MMRRRRCVVGFSACAAWPFRILSAPPHPVLAWVRSRVLLVDALAITLSVNFAPEDGWRRRTVMGVETPTALPTRGREWLHVAASGSQRP